jgi:hypothetical protein
MPDDKKKLKKLHEARKAHLATAKPAKNSLAAKNFDAKTKAYDNAIIKTSKKTGDFQTKKESQRLGTMASTKVDKNSIAMDNKSIDRLTKQNNANWSKSKTGQNW